MNPKNSIKKYNKEFNWIIKELKQNLSYDLLNKGIK